VFDLFSLPKGGGTVSVVYKLSRALAERGHDVTVYTSDYQFNNNDIGRLQGIHVYPFHCWSKVGNFYFTPRVVDMAKRDLRQFDIIHLHCFRSFQNIILHHYAREYGVPYILDCHGSFPRQHGKYFLKWLFDTSFGNNLLKDTSRVIAETKSAASEYHAGGITDNLISIIAPPFAIEEFTNLPERGAFRKKYGLTRKHLIVFLGRIHWIKGLSFLVDSFAQLGRTNTTLALVGSDDGYKAALEKQIKALNLTDRVLFTGFLSGQDKLSALVDADVVVQVSSYEQGTGVPFEAVLCNTPIIVTKTTGSENVSKIDAGYLVEYGNITELRDIMEYVLGHPTEAEVKTNKAKEYIKTNLSLERVVQKYESIYAECKRVR
jgi:glycosyltransferase involved in cell wall biosynthesis